MSPASCSPAGSPSLDSALAVLRARGLRASSARRLVIAALVAAGRPVTAEAIARGLDGRVPPSDIGSVYRNLDALEQAGIVSRLAVGHGAALYALTASPDAGYLACRRCHEVHVADPEALATVRDVVHSALGYDVSFTDVALVGICSRCAQVTGV